jgi:glyoxylase-like metal-dependent hydrolase (beta-lactamase superfamily II)
LNESEKWCIAGDALFHESIGRTDLPGGDYDTLITSIMDNLLVLNDEVRIYPGHGPSTTIGHERVHNPFL